MFIKSYWKSILWFLVIILLSVLSTNKLPSVNVEFKHIDKIAHFIMYFLFSYFIMEGYALHQKGPRKLAVFMAFLIPFVVGLSTEYVQEIFTSTREGDPWDFLSNTIGIIAGILLFRKLYPIQMSLMRWFKHLMVTMKS
jgi:VanZ family protein